MVVVGYEGMAERFIAMVYGGADVVLGTCCWDVESILWAGCGFWAKIGIGLWIGTFLTGSSQVLFDLLLFSKFWDPRIFRTASLASSSLLISFTLGLV